MATATTKAKTKATQTKTQAKRTTAQAKQATQAAKATAEQAQRTLRTVATDSVYATLGVTDRAAELVRNLGDVRSDAPEYVRALREQSKHQFDELAERGRKRVESIRRTRKTAEARNQVDRARSQVKAAATSLGRAFGANVEAAAKIVEKVGTTVNERRQPQRRAATADQRPYEERTVEELRERAAELDIEGRSQMSKDELIKALRDAS